MFIEKRVVEVCFGANRIKCSAVESTDFVNELVTEVRALLVLRSIIEIDLITLCQLCGTISKMHALPGQGLPSMTRSLAVAPHPCPSPSLLRSRSIALPHATVAAHLQVLVSLDCWTLETQCVWQLVWESVSSSLFGWSRSSAVRGV